MVWFVSHIWDICFYRQRRKHAFSSIQLATSDSAFWSVLKPLLAQHWLCLTLNVEKWQWVMNKWQFLCKTNKNKPSRNDTPPVAFLHLVEVIKWKAQCWGSSVRSLRCCCPWFLTAWQIGLKLGGCWSPNTVLLGVIGKSGHKSWYWNVWLLPLLQLLLSDTHSWSVFGLCLSLRIDLLLLIYLLTSSCGVWSAARGCRDKISSVFENTTLEWVWNKTNAWAKFKL